MKVTKKEESVDEKPASDPKLILDKLRKIKPDHENTAHANLRWVFLINIIIKKIHS